MKPTLTEHTAKDYVRGYFQGLDRQVTVHRLDACSHTSSDGTPIMRVTVDITDEGKRESLLWDVWLEDDGEGGQCLMGEF